MIKIDGVDVLIGVNEAGIVSICDDSGSNGISFPVSAVLQVIAALQTIVGGRVEPDYDAP